MPDMTYRPHPKDVEAICAPRSEYMEEPAKACACKMISHYPNNMERVFFVSVNKTHYHVVATSHLKALRKVVDFEKIEDSHRCDIAVKSTSMEILV